MINNIKELENIIELLNAQKDDAFITSFGKGMLHAYNNVFGLVKTLSSSKFILLEDKKPICYQTGDWDGKKSDQLLCKDVNGEFWIANCYEGTMDGSIFHEWYSVDDYGLQVEVTHWTSLDKYESNCEISNN